MITIITKSYIGPNFKEKIPVETNFIKSHKKVT